MNKKLKALFAIYFITGVDKCGYVMVFALFPPLLLNPKYDFLTQHPSIAAKLITLGLLYAAFPLAQLLASPLIGELADRYGRKKLLLVTVSGTLIGYFLTGAILTLKSPLLLFFGRFVTGLCAANQGICNAALADLSPSEKHLAKNFGYLTVVWGIGFPLALLLGGFFSDPALSAHFSPSLPFYIVGVLTALTLFPLHIFYHEKLPEHTSRFSFNLFTSLKDIKEALTAPQARRYFLLMLLWTLGWAFSMNWYGAYGIKKFGVSQEEVTLGLILLGLVWISGGSFFKPLLLKYMQVKTIAKYSYLATAIIYGVTALMPTFYTFVAVCALSAIPGALALSTTFNLISLSFHFTVQGRAMGLSQAMMSVGYVIVPLLGGFSGALSINTYYPLSALFMLMGLLVLMKPISLR